MGPQMTRTSAENERNFAFASTRQDAGGDNENAGWTVRERRKAGVWTNLS